MTYTTACSNTNAKWLHIAAAAAFLLASSPNVALLAQGLDAEGAIDTIIGSDIETREETAKEDKTRLIAAIENTTANVSEARKKFSLDALNIVFVPDMGEDNGLAEKLDEFAAPIKELREAIEGNAMLYHAVNSEGVLLKDIVALEFDNKNNATVFVAAKSTN